MYERILLHYSTLFELRDKFSNTSYVRSQNGKHTLRKHTLRKIYVFVYSVAAL